MKTLSLIAVSTVAFVSTVAHAGFASVNTFIARYQDASGLTSNYAGGAVSASGIAAGSTISNVSSTPWQFSVTQPDNSLSYSMSLGSPAATYTESYVDSWIGGYGNGVWSANLGNGAFQFDTSSYYQTAAQRSYATLTAASVSLWNTIVSTNATGTYTFELTQSLSSLGMIAGYASTNIGGSVSLDANSTTFSVNFTQENNTPIAAFLYIGGVANPTTIYSANGDTVSYSNSFATVIGGGAVPAPGAIALLGLAGLAGRRRR